MSVQKKAKAIISHLRRDLFAARKAAEYWEVMAVTDDLTGLHNRRMIESADIHIQKNRRSPSDEVALLFIDLDDFGHINKHYGDDVGDQALALLGRSLRHNIREHDLAIRKGGDEFVLFLMGTTFDDACGSVVKRLESLLGGELFITAHGQNIPIRGSIGAFVYDASLSPFENIKQADAKMRLQKATRKSQINKAALPMPTDTICLKIVGTTLT